MNIQSLFLSRNFSAELIRELSIIFDLPYRYLADQYAEFKLKNLFEEYERTNIKTSSLSDIINEAILEMKEKQINRKIFGINPVQWGIQISMIPFCLMTQKDLLL